MALKSSPSTRFSEVLAAEHEFIKERRATAQQPQGNPAADSVGLGLSGGGVRSATFNLGLLQALYKRGILQQVDYLSTVSGGGYIGTCLTWLKSRVPDQFPFGTRRKDHASVGGRVLAWLRGHGSYLIPGDGISVWSLIAAVLTGSLVNLAVLVPVFLAIFYLLSREFIHRIIYPDYFAWLLPPIDSLGIKGNDGFSLVLFIALGLMVCFFISIAVYVLSTRFDRFRDYGFQRNMREISGLVLMASVILVVVGSIPAAYHLLVDQGLEWLKLKMTAFPAAGAVAVAGGMHGRKKENETRSIRAVLFSLGLTLMVYGLFLFFYRWTLGPDPLVGPAALWPMLLISVFLAVVANINHVSMHRFYRNRLMEAYMPAAIKGAGYEPGKNPPYYPYAPEKEADRFCLHDIHPTDAPYPIINTNLQTIGSNDQKLSQRGGENFIFSPGYVGSGSTDWVKTRNYMGGAFSLATAMAISGAAVDPNSYATRSRPLTFLMSLLNIRLGCWVRNPRHKEVHKKLRTPLWYYYIFREMLGKGLDENCWQIHLSDGGHFENLGLYELVRRRCRTIIISDAAADPKYSFADLARAIELVRVDFGARVEIDITLLQPASETRQSPAAMARGKVYYNDDGKTGCQGPGQMPATADLFYVKTTLVKGLSEDIYAYGRSHPDFPDQTTADQFFDETQFEAYRELGFLIGRQLDMGLGADQG